MEWGWGVMVAHGTATETGKVWTRQTATVSAVAFRMWDVLRALPATDDVHASVSDGDLVESQGDAVV